MSKSSLYDLAIELINDAKNKRDGQSKIYILEQIREIIFHRDTSIFNDLFPQLINSFMIDNSVPVKKLIIRLAIQGLKHQFNATSTIPTVINMINYFTISDAQDVLLHLLIKDIHIYFVDIIMYICNMPPKVKSSSSQVDATQLWSSFRSSITYFSSLISSDRSDNLRASCLKLLEVIVLFGIPPPPATTDPRLLRVMRTELSNVVKSKTAEDIPLHHSFINRNELTQESEDFFSKMLLWANKNGPQGFVFSTSLVALLGEVIASIAVLRPKKGTEAAKAITAMIQGKLSLCSVMSPSEREQLARVTHRLLKMSLAFSDPEGIMPKLRAALSGLEALGLSSKSDTTSGQKRSADDIDIDEETEQKKLRDSALAALDLLELQRKSPMKATHTTHSSQVDGDANLKQSTSTSVVSSVVVTETELVNDFSVTGMNQDFAPIDFKNLKMINIDHSINSNSLEYLSATVTMDSYQELSLQSLQRLLDSYSDITLYGSKALVLHRQLIVRESLALMNFPYETKEIKDSTMLPNRLQVNVSVVIALPSAAKALNKIPLEVVIPRSIWMVIIFTLKADPKSPSESIILDKLNILLTLIFTIYSRIHESELEKNNELFANIQSIYESICFVSISRLISNSNLRGFIPDFLNNLPEIPQICLSLLQILMYTGTKSQTGAIQAYGKKDSHQKDQDVIKNRGTKIESLSLLNHIIISSSDIQTTQTCLNYLLWASIVDDFELRTKVVSTLVNETIPQAEYTKDSINLFAIHAIITLIDLELLNQMKNRKNNRINCPISKNLAEISTGISSENAMEIDSEQSIVANDAIDVETAITPFEMKTESLLIDALETFDNGKMFNGVFSPSECTNFENQAKKKLQLLSQLCVGDVRLLMVFVDLYAVAALGKEQIKPETDKIIEKVEDSSNKETESRSLNLFEILQKAIASELTNIIPIISKQIKPEDVFILLVNIDPLSLPILEVIVELLHYEPTLPASSLMIERVLTFSSHLREHNLYSEENALSLALPLLGGMASDILETTYLPNLVKYFATPDKTEKLKQSFHRVVFTRPPPLSKTSLLISLHRYVFSYSPF